MLSTIINKFKSLFKSEDNEIELSTPSNTTAEFELTYKKLLIGSLQLSNGIWLFAYSTEFKAQNKITAITDFPDTNKIYQSNILFPFFASRIPSLQRLAIQKIVAKNITTDEVSLLKMFGKQSITNPYQLMPHS